MTYCLAINTKSGLVFASDSRVYVGVDDTSTHSKMHTFGNPGDRQIVVLSAGDLATTQAVIGQLKTDIRDRAVVNLMTVSSIPDAANYLGQVNLSAQGKFATSDSKFEASFIIGGQIRDELPNVRRVEPSGDHRSSTKGTPYLQIGESKYGKPILDRILTANASLDTAASCALVSMDPTMRSNLRVGPPIEVLLYEKDTFSCARHYRFAQDSEYIRQLNESWNSSLKDAFKTLPPIDWGPTWDQEAVDDVD